MSIAFVQQKTATASAVTSVSVAFDADVTAGNAIIAPVSWYDSGTPNLQASGVTDTQSNSYAIAVQHDTTNASVAIPYALNAAGGATTVTIDPDGTGLYFGVAIAEFSGVAASAAVDETATNNGSSTTPSVGPTAALDSSDQLAVAVAVANISGSSNVGFDVPATTGYTNLYVYQNWTAIVSHASDYKIGATNTGESAAWGTLTATAAWAGVIATFRAASAAGSAETAFQFDAF